MQINESTHSHNIHTDIQNVEYHGIEFANCIKITNPTGY